MEGSLTSRIDRGHFRRVLAVRNWALWDLPRWLAAFILILVAADLAGIGFAGSGLAVRGHDLLTFGVLLTCLAASVELSRRTGENAGHIKDVYGVWELSIAILLPPLYVMVAPIMRIALVWWRVRRGVLHRRVLSAASLGLSFGAASATFHGLSGTLTSLAPRSMGWSAAWLGIVVVSAFVYSVLNKLIIMTAVKGSDPSERVIAALLQREPLYNDLAELCIGMLVAYGVATNIFLAPVALPIIALLHRSLRHAQLLNASRTDAKTGLLNARTWEREATAEVARAVRAHVPLAVAVLDIDLFKRINDTYGHLFGDEAIKEIARCLPGVLREYDSAGRFGGEEFVLLLPHTRAVDAFRIADRVRDHISGLSLRTADGQAVQITVSVGVAALDAGSRRELSELLAAADAALYRAKRDGRNQVQMISTTRGLSAVGGRGANGSNVFGGVPAKAAVPSAWDVPPEPAGTRPAGDSGQVARV